LQDEGCYCYHYYFIIIIYITVAYQEHGDADLQEDPDDDDDVAVDEDGDDQVERAVVGAHSDEAIELGGAAESAKALRTLLCTFLQARFTNPLPFPAPRTPTLDCSPVFSKAQVSLPSCYGSSQAK
jgi:hypothetical protein